MAFVVLVGQDLASVDRRAAAERDDDRGAPLVNQVKASLDVLDWSVLANLAGQRECWAAMYLAEDADRLLAQEIGDPLAERQRGQ